MAKNTRTMNWVLVGLLCTTFRTVAAIDTINIWFKGQEALIINFNESKNTIEAAYTNNGSTKINGILGKGINVTTLSREGNCFSNDETKLCVDSKKPGFEILWQANTTSDSLTDCFDLGESNWFGGPEIYYADWPVERYQLNDSAYITNKGGNGAVKEAYWLNSNGGCLIVNEITPLFVDQRNTEENGICLSAKLQAPYNSREKVSLKYTIYGGDNPKDAHLNAARDYLGIAKKYPNENMIREPIWTTWAKYKKDIDDQTVLDFATSISERGYKGQIEIDDFWETCYGSLIFNDKFDFINSTVQSLKVLNFRVTLWTHPFINNDCEEAQIGKDNGYFIKNEDGSDETDWWDGSKAHHIDFTNPEAVKWYTDRLKLIQNKHGIDSFKFDAGEADYPPSIPKLNADENLIPNAITTEYVKTCATFGDLIEVRSAWRTQTLGIFVRMLDKESSWGLDNGLHSLITTLLQMNMIGYSMVLPDMIGGNGYGDPPTAELLVRWAQANTFMPTMQLSYLPWEITSGEFNCEEIVKKYIDLHEEMSDEIIEAMKKHMIDGTPVNPPIWWVDPTNVAAHACNDQYLLGERILVAPVIEEGSRSRDVILPLGTWQDGNTGDIYEGGQILKDYPAPIDILPWFIKQN